MDNKEMNNKTIKYFLYDTETGGTTPESNSLLSLYGMFLDDEINYNIIDEVDFFLIPDDKIYHLNAGAMNVNKINIQKHSEQAIKYSEARIKLTSILDTYTDFGKNKLIPIGHNIPFDIAYLKQYILTGDLYEKYFAYGSVDTKSVAQFLKMQGKIPDNVSTSLVTLSKHLNCKLDKTEDDFHNAEYDARVTLNLLKALLKL